MQPDLLSMLALWWQEKSAFLPSQQASLRLQTMSNPGWMLQLVGVKDIVIDEAHAEEFTGAPSEWVSVDQGFGVILLMSGPFKLNEILWRFLRGTMGNLFYTVSVPEVPRYYHGMYMQEGLFDLAQRLQKWFISNCDYCWEEEFGFKLIADANVGWTLEMDTGSEAPLGKDDYAILNSPIARAELAFSKEGRNLICRCAAEQFTEMLARALEFVEGDWREEPERKV